jgi:hydrogenase maturation protease
MTMVAHPEKVEKHHDKRRATSPSILVIGVGNEYRSDDGLGLYAVRELRLRIQSDEHRLPESVCIIEESGEGTALMNAWQGYEHVFIIDAVLSGKTPGDVHVVDAIKETIPKRIFRCSSHQLGVAEAVEMARKLNRLPATLKVYGIEVLTVEPGVGLSEPVVRSMADLFHLVEEDIRKVAALTVLEKP